MSEIEEIKARLDIVDVVGQYVQLHKAGRAYKALCPFHNERTPSFVVSPERQSWHCFGACGTGGDIVSFVMRREGLEFPEALRLLAQRAGVSLRPRDSQREQQDRQHERLYAANEAAARFFHEQLDRPAGREARQYTQGRGVGPAAIRQFLLGYSPPAWDALRSHLREAGFSDAEMLAAGLVVEAGGSLHDRFRGRLMFPIRDAQGKITGFGGRSLDSSQPKYLNTPQTALFDKGGLLYALDSARDGIRREGRAVIVEGYMDAIAAHEHGFDNVVATMGTALTERQVRLLKRLTGEVVLALDADAAGSDAAVRGHDVVRETLDQAGGAVPVVTWRGLVGYQSTVAVQLYVAVLPEGRDPDEVIREDPELWRRLIQDARPVLDYRLEAAAAERDLTNPQERSRLVQDYLPLLAEVSDPVVRAHYIQRLSRLALVSEAEISAMARAGRRRRPAGAQAPMPGPATPRGDPREEFLLALLLQNPALRDAGLEVPEDLLWESENRQLLMIWKEHGGSEGVKEAVPLELRPHFERLSERRLPAFGPQEALEALEDCRSRLEHRQVEAEKQALAALLAARQEEFGPAALIEALEREPQDEQAREVITLQMRDLETGLKLHSRERSGGSGAARIRTND